MRHMVLATLVAVGCSGLPDPEVAADELLAVDRGFASSVGQTDLLSGLRTMFADDVVMRAPGRLAVGVEDVMSVLVANPANVGARMTWTPVRVVISADGTHGVTYGYGTVTRAGGDTAGIKYLSYWERSSTGWRVSAYHRVVRGPGAVSYDALPPILPERMVAPADSSVAARYAMEVGAVEGAFSDTAQRGLARAFRMFGAEEAMHMGGPDDAAFRFGPDSIAAGVGDLAPGQSIRWGSTLTRAASSGDLGVSIGIIDIGVAGADGAEATTRPIPFFTVWWRRDRNAPWRYLAE